MIIFPAIQYRVGILLVLVFTLPELIGWMMLLSPHAKEYTQRLVDAKEQIAIIRQDLSHISQQFGTIIDKLKNPPTSIVNPPEATTTEIKQDTLT